MTSSGGVTGVEVTRSRWRPSLGFLVAIGLLLLGATAVVLDLLGVTRGALGETRFAVTAAFVLLGPGWALTGFLGRDHDATFWILAIATSTAVTVLGAQAMLLTGWWRPSVALFIVVGLSAPALVRHAVVAR